MRWMIITACLATILAPGVPRAEDFTPWNSDVAVGDAVPGREHGARVSRKGTVYSGAQAGAWFLIRFFQTAISPQDGPNCRHVPTCSRYGKEAVERYGALLGAFMAGDRLIRCNPYNPPANDPVPPKLR